MRICKLEGCENKHFCKGYCSKHYSRLQRYGDPVYTKNDRDQESHGMYKTPEYKTWEKIKMRCSNKNYKYYHRYGGRGIVVCDHWLNSFANFLDDMGPKPFPKAQIDRIDNDGNYEPENCRWATNAENNRNRSNNKLTISKVKEIRKLYRTGNFTQRKLGKLYGINQTTIGKIIRNKNWIITKQSGVAG